MKLKWITVLGILLFAGQASAAETAVLKTYEEKVSYGLGVDMARNLTRMGIEFDTDILIKGFKDEASRGKLLLTEDELRATLSTHYGELARKREEATRLVAEENKKMGEAFLAENRTKEGVVTLASGLQYKILKAGSGRNPTDGDTVECHYRGALVNGTEFDSSYRASQPATFKVKGVIPGWTEALKLMPVGSKWQLFIPPELAYGEKGAASRHVGPNTTIIFELELISIK
jgi:UDP-GlcNAc:undecaprenyl-phosphate/decaprenyl-phosphate GlcNAc-1-phosphate transferase